MKVGIVGLGYWGKIILLNLENLKFSDIYLCENQPTKFKYPVIEDYTKLDCDFIFITTPTSTHYEICKHFLEQSISIFCEKPLTTSSSEAEDLYNIAEKNDSILFTDWIFTFNNHIDTLKRDYERGKLGKAKSIFMNRLNLGPKRDDVNARWDLASHDVSIIQYIFGEKPVNINWTDYKRNKDAHQHDSCLGLLEYKDFVATINASWHYRKKVRECIFEFENYFVVWDDFKRVLQYEDATNVNFPIYSGNLSYPCGEYYPPLKNSINQFFKFNKNDMLNQKELTLETIEILES